jgi:8-amino-7-oxononanoate synthase
MPWFDSRLNAKVSKRKEQGLFRTLKVSDKLIDFCSNDYLGFARSHDLHAQICQRLEKFPPSNGATGSRLLSGNFAYTEEVEDKLARIFHAEAALIFNSGYTANLAVFSCLPQKGDTILYDELVHACIKDGARLSLAARHSFHHNDLHDLEKKLRSAKGKKFIAIESVYSMDGDAAPLRDIVAIAEKYDAIIILDEAHSTGVYGKAGSGLAVMQQLEHKIAVRVYTFGKAMGIHGACVAGSKILTDYLVNFARPFIYTTALPLHSIAAIDVAFEYLSANETLQLVLQQKISHFLEHTRFVNNKTVSNSAIQTLITPGNENAKQTARYLQKEGFDIRPILSPTVQVDTERLRICLHTFNSDQEIERLAKTLATSIPTMENK